ncbi:hypothetical protein [Thalassobaculum sp.]|uniref:hypothetical protein n=1 Tax=Thalassobaculum sp. TaxID=2022740 RepID=UPI0032F02346
MRMSERRKAHGKRPGPAPSAGPGLLDARATLVALALILLLGLAAFPLLKDGRVLDNLGAGLRYWAGANR